MVAIADGEEYQQLGKGADDVATRSGNLKITRTQVILYGV
jgi:hypothetical protein